MRKQIISLLTVLIMLCSLSTMAFAHDIPSMSEKGSIEITIHCGHTIITNGTIVLYRVGEIYEDNGNYSFALTGDFISCGQSLEDVHSSELAKDLADYATDQTLTGVTKEIDQNGKVKFSDLDLGLYLLVQSEISEGYNKADPFLVSVPMMENGKYVYHIDASPKVELEKEQEPTSPPTMPDPILPQTGQLNWPVPLLVVMGLGIFAVGWVLRFGWRKGPYEK